MDVRELRILQGRRQESLHEPAKNHDESERGMVCSM
jgi:hypothetical protein